MIVLDEEVIRRLKQAIDSGNVPTAAYVDTQGKPRISFYGSTHVHGPDSLAIWVRNPESELLKALSEKPEMAFVYGDVKDRVYYWFEGRARIAEADRKEIYANIHPIEQQFDPEKKGVPVVVELDSFTALSRAGRITQIRDDV